MFEVSLVPGAGPGEGRTANVLVLLKTPMPLAQLLNELEINGLFDYEPTIETNGSLWWHYGLISWLEHKGYSVAGSTSNFLQWLAIHNTELKAVPRGSSNGISETDLKGDFTRGKCPVVQWSLSVVVMTETNISSQDLSS
jgi:hypothetical protein